MRFFDCCQLASLHTFEPAFAQCCQFPEEILANLVACPVTAMLLPPKDFGLAISLGPTATHVSNFRSGTPFYCAPEASGPAQLEAVQEMP